MTSRSAYIMQEQVHNLVPSLMSSDVPQKGNQSAPPLHLISIAAISAVYMLVMVFTG